MILLQADEVVTKSQESGRKMNQTFTATLEIGAGRCEYLSEWCKHSWNELDEKWSLDDGSSFTLAEQYFAYRGFGVILRQRFPGRRG